MRNSKGFEAAASSSSTTATNVNVIKVVSKLTRLLVETPAWQDVCVDALQQVGQTLDVSRVYLFREYENNEDATQDGCYYLWQANEQAFPAEKFPRKTPGKWLSALRKNATLTGRVKDFSQATQKVLLARQTETVLAVPIVHGSDWYGYICVESTDAERTWTDEEAEGLRCVATVFSAAIEWQLGRQRRLQHKNQFVLTMENAACGIAYVDNKNAINYANEFCCTLLDYSTAQLSTLNLCDFIYSEDLKAFKKHMRVMQSSQSYNNKLEQRWVRKGGEIIWVSLTFLQTEQANENQWVLIIEDITERYIAQKLLEDSEQRFEIVSRVTNDAIWDWSYETNTIWWNSGMERLFGYSAEEISPAYSWWEERVHPDDLQRVLNELDALTANKRSYWTSEYRFRYGSGGYATVFDRAYVFYNDAGIAIRMIGSVQDISKQKKADHDLQESYEALRNLAKRSNQVREDERKHLSRELHDEFAQILTALKMDLQWMGSKIPAEHQNLVERTHAMTEIVNSTMDRVRQIASELRPALIDDLGICAAIDWQLKEFYARTGCVCSADIAIDETELEDNLKIMLFRIFQEALSNVARHTRATRVHVRLYDEDHIIFLSLKDNGDGIPAKKLNDVNSIGLIGMRERASAFGGAVNIQSSKKGTTINVRIPIAADVFLV